MKSNIAHFILVMALSALTACGSGGGDSSGSESETKNAGGTISAPSSIREDIKNSISSDEFNNYFKVQALSGDTLIIKATMNATLDPTLYSRCVTESDYTISIGSEKSCSLNIKYKFTADGEYKIHFKFPGGNSGYFNAVVLTSSTTIVPSATANGAANQPRTISLGGTDNALSANDFFNNFAYNAEAGDTLHIQLYPSVNPSPTDSNRCLMANGEYNIYYSFGVAVVGISEYNCNNTFEYTFSSEGQHYLNIRFINGAQGYFHATVVPAA
ncbi:MAG: hypothetical protein ACRERR_11525 [Moraxellaceae bacterium]